MFRKATFFTILGVFAITALVAVAGLIGAVRIEPEFQRCLNGAFLGESATCIFLIARRSDFLGTDSVDNLKEESWRLLATLWTHQKQTKGGVVWGMTVNPAANNFRSYLRGVSQLYSLELVSIGAENWMVGLTNEGMDFCAQKEKRLLKITNLFFIVRN
jgi:hypothetical protein